MPEPRLKSSLTMEEVKNNFKDTNFFAEVMGVWVKSSLSSKKPTRKINSLISDLQNAPLQ